MFFIVVAATVAVAVIVFIVVHIFVILHVIVVVGGGGSCVMSLFFQAVESMMALFLSMVYHSVLEQFNETRTYKAFIIKREEIQKVPGRFALNPVCT